MNCRKPLQNLETSTWQVREVHAATYMLLSLDPKWQETELPRCLPAQCFQASAAHLFFCKKLFHGDKSLSNNDIPTWCCLIQASNMPATLQIHITDTFPTFQADILHDCRSLHQSTRIAIGKLHQNEPAPSWALAQAINRVCTLCAFNTRGKAQTATTPTVDDLLASAMLSYICQYANTEPAPCHKQWLSGNISSCKLHQASSASCILAHHDHKQAPSQEI